MSVHYILQLLPTFCLLANAANYSNGYADTEAKILILGAGASGLQAARTLHDAGMDDFIIIEGAGRIGGRVQSIRFAGVTVELGALWAAPKDSQIVQIVRSLDLDRYTSNFGSLTIRNQTGHNVTDEAQANYQRLEEGLDKLHKLSARLKSNNRIPDMSQRAALRIGKWHPESAIDKAIEWYEHDFEYGERPELCSLRAAVPPLGEQTIDLITDERGFIRIFDEIAGFLQAPEYVNHTRLNQKVVSIDQTNRSSVAVTCEDGTVYIGEYVLVTFSIGVLQHDLVRFIPPLPEWKDVEIKKTQTSAYTSIYLSFPKKFWDDTEWILHASETRGYYPVFLNHQSKGLREDTAHMLLATVGGDESRRVEAQPLADTKAEIEAVLRSMYGDSIPEATNILVSNWTQDPLTRGAYSNAPLGVSEECRQKLESRVGRLFFGGEATSRLFAGYVVGGLDSGEREAFKMLKCLKDFDDCPGFEGGLECWDASSSHSSSRNSV